MILSKLLNVEKQRYEIRFATLDQSGVEAVIGTFKKQLEEELEFAIKAKDEWKIEKLNYDIELVKRYLPQQLTIDEIKTIIKGVIDKTEERSRNIGNIMKQVNPLTKGRADGKVVNQIVKESLQ